MPKNPKKRVAAVLERLTSRVDSMRRLESDNTLYICATYCKTKQSKLLEFCQLILQHDLETKRLKCHSFSYEVLAHCFDPVQAQRMQHGTSSFHHHQDGDSKGEPDCKRTEDNDNAGGSFELESVGESHGPEHDGELLMSERKRPKTKIGGCV